MARYGEYTIRALRRLREMLTEAGVYFHADDQRRGIGLASRPGARSRRPALRYIFAGCAALCVAGWPAHSYAAPYPEDAVKAIFLYRFAGYITWPRRARATPKFTIAVAGDDRVADELAGFLPTHPVGNQPAQVRRITGPSEAGDAQIVFIGTDYDGDLRAFVQSLAHRPVLVVTDRQGGLSSGSIVNFLLIGQHVRFEISLSAATRADLKMSAQLLAVANHVDTGWLRPLSACMFHLVRGAAEGCPELAALR